MAHFQDKGKSLIYCLKESTVHTGAGLVNEMLTREKARLSRGRVGQERPTRLLRSAIWGAFAWSGGRKRSLQLMVYRGLESQPVRHGGSYLVEEQTWFAQCSPFRSHSQSSRRFREVRLVLTSNSRPLLAPPPPSQNVRKGLVSLYRVQNKQTLKQWRGAHFPSPSCQSWRWGPWKAAVFLLSG